MIDARTYGPWAVIAGASEGIGVSFAHQLAKHGIHLVLVARQGALLERVARAIETENSVQVRTVQCDLSHEAMLDQLRKVTDDIEVGLVVCNAGASTGSGYFAEASLEDALRAVRLGPAGHIALAHHFGKKMLARGRGGFILMGSLAGNAGASTTVLYSAAKAFSQILAEGLWSEWSPLGVNVLYAVLGATRTPARERAGFKDDPRFFVAEPEDVARECLENIANGPVYVPAHIKDAFQHFSSMPRREAAEMMTNLLQGFQS